MVCGSVINASVRIASSSGKAYLYLEFQSSDTLFGDEQPLPFTLFFQESAMERTVKALVALGYTGDDVHALIASVRNGDTPASLFPNTVNLNTRTKAFGGKTTVEVESVSLVERVATDDVSGGAVSKFATEMAKLTSKKRKLELPQEAGSV